MFAGSSEKTLNHFAFQQIAALPNSDGVAGALAGIDGDVMIIAGGSNFPGKPPWNGGTKTFYSDIYVLALKPESSPVWINQPTRLAKPIGYSAVAPTLHGIVCLGGETAEGPTDNAFILRFDKQKQLVTITELPRLPAARTGATATTIGNRVYFLGGQNGNDFSDEMFSLDLSKPTQGWRSEPKLPKPVAFAAAVTQSNGETNCIYLLGGRARLSDNTVTQFSDAVYSFQPKTNSWREESPLPMPLAAGSAAALGMASIFLVGGDNGEFFNANEQRQQYIDTKNNPETKQKLLDEKKRLLENHQGFQREVFLYNTITKVWTIPFHLPEGSQVTTPAAVWISDQCSSIIIPSGESKPGIRTAKINAFQIFSKTQFTLIDYGVLALYMLIVLGLGFLFMQRNTTQGDFFLGGGRLPWWAVGISIFATMLSAITFLSVPAKAFATEWRMFPYNLATILVAPLVIRYYLPYFRNMNLGTAYEYLELRFNRTIRYFASLLFAFFMISRIAIVLFLPSLALNIVTGIDVYFCIILMSLVTITYCTLGGMEAVVWNDVIQGIILIFGAIISLAVLVVSSQNGIAGFFETAYTAGKFHTFDLRFDLTEPVFWVVIAGAIANNLIVYSSDQSLVQRYMCTTNNRQAVWSIWLNALLAIPVILLFFPIGTALFTYYHGNPEQFDAVLKNADAIYPLFIVHGLPAGFSGLVIAAIFAAAMSTLSANINSVSVSISIDFLNNLCPKILQRYPVRIPQIVGILSGLMGMILALLLATWDIRSLWDQFNTFLGLFTGTLGGLFLMGVFSKRINHVGAMCGLILSFVVVVFVHLSTPLSFLLYGFLGMISCYVTGYIVSLFFGGSAKTVVVVQKTET
ncbi:MAG: sodium/solute symporter [Planctomycetaceae bacterium]|jgi:SSS family transporter|nr:sodium/solute symporter [Planctomycetaceae bacterium]